MRRALILGSLACAACGFGHRVDQDGEYVIIAPSPVDDSAVYPLSSLLYLERDVGRGQTRLYCFTGDLRAANLGLEDLRRIAARFGGFQMTFDPPIEHIDPDSIQSHGDPLEAQIGDQTLELVRLDDDALQPTAAQRFVSSVSSTDYDIAAYFGVIDNADPLPNVTIEATGIAYAPPDDDPGLSLIRDSQRLGISYHSSADYLTLELSQTIHSRADDSAIDASVRTLAGADSSYAVSPQLLSNVTGQGCWSETSLEGRMEQTARYYQPRAGGDWAVVYTRSDALEIKPSDWTPLLGGVNYPGYCGGYE
jgi:hypothetical protein